MSNLSRSGAVRRVAALGYPGAEPMFDAAFLACKCPPTHEVLNIACAAVYALGRSPGIKRYRCAQCGQVTAHKAAWSQRAWPPGCEPVLDARGRPVVVGETEIAIAR